MLLNLINPFDDLKNLEVGKEFDTFMLFDKNKAMKVINLGENNSILNKFVAQMRDREVQKDSMVNILSVEFCGAVSPEGSVPFNHWLSVARLTELEKYVRKRVHIPEEIITRSDHYIAWDELRAMVLESDLPNKDAVIEIIDSENTSVGNQLDSRIGALKAMDGGKTWKIIFDRYFIHMRNAYMVIVTEKSEKFYEHRRRNMVAAMPSLSTVAQSQSEPVSLLPVVAAASSALIDTRYMYVKTNLVGLTGLGLVEMTRKKMRAPLCETMEQPCPLCMERGRIDSAETVGLRILDKLEEEAGRSGHPVLTVLCNPIVAAWLLSEENGHLNQLEQTYSREILLRGDNHMAVQEFQVKGRAESACAQVLPVNKGEVLEVLIEKRHQNQSSDGIARINGFVIHVKDGGSLAGSGKPVMVEIEHVMRTHAEASLIKTEEVSE